MSPSRGGGLAFSAAFLLLWTVSTEDAIAQVNIEALRTDLQKTPALANLQGTFTGRTGNTQSVEVGASATGAARAGRHAFFGSSEADYSRFSGQTTVSKSFIHFRWHYELFRWLYPEAFIQQQQDKFQRLQLRELAGAGPRFNIYDEDELKIAVGSAYMFEFERISVPAGAPDAPTDTASRWSNYLTSTWQPDSRVRAIATFYLQPKFDNFKDYRALFEVALVTAIAKRLSVKVSGSIRYDSRPPTDVKTTDTEVKNAFVLTF